MVIFFLKNCEYILVLASLCIPHVAGQGPRIKTLRFPLSANSRGITSSVTKLNAALCLNTKTKKLKYFIFNFPLGGIEPSTRRVYRLVPLRHDWPLNSSYPKYFLLYSIITRKEISKYKTFSLIFLRIVRRVTEEGTWTWPNYRDSYHYDVWCFAGVVFPERILNVTWKIKHGTQRKHITI